MLKLYQVQEIPTYFLIDRNCDLQSRMETIDDINKALESLLWFFRKENLQSRKILHTFAAVNHNKQYVKGSSIHAGILFLLRCENEGTMETLKKLKQNKI